jgi:DNA-binding FadR family transcriptional regulator
MNAAERIYVASTQDGDTSARLAEELARRMEDDIAAAAFAAGAALGALRELSERYCVGRSVVREALGLLERRGLGRMRPGPSGGFILSKPRPEDIGAQLADYFRATGVTLTQVTDAREAVDLMAARLAASGARPDGRAVVLLFDDCVNRLTADFCRSDGTHASRDRASRAPATGRLSSTIARELAADIARSGNSGARLGSEWDLCERFNVSRLTLRQAIRLLQDSGLVECRRGRGNGLVVRDRRGAGSIRLLLAYLIGETMDPMAAGTILFQLNCFIPALAVARASANGRAQLEAALARVESCDPFDRYDLLGLVHCVSQLADSPIIDLFSRCLVAYEARFRASLAERLPGSAQASYFQLVRRLLDRLPIGDSRNLGWAKAESSRLMLEMSLHRPI